jgi:putative transposase
MTCRAHRIELDPTVAQAIYFAKACGTARFAYNWALDRWKKKYEAGEKVNEGMLRREFNAEKHSNPELSWITQVSKMAPQYAIKGLGEAFKGFFSKKAKYPTRHKKGRRDSFRADNGEGISVTDTHIAVPRLGQVRLKEPLRFQGRIIQAVVSKEADRWFIAITVDLGESWSRKSETVDHRNDAVGVDLGLTHAAVLSTGEKIEGPKPLRRNLKKLKRLSRQLSKKVKGSANRRKAKVRLARCHSKIKNIRKDWSHKFTTRLCRENQAVVIEDLKVSNMLKNRRLARAISDVGWYEIRRQLEYKSKDFGTKLVTADQWMPSSKTCSNCGVKREGVLPLSVREWSCPDCGAVHDRDINAAKNLRALAVPLAVPRVTRELTPVESKASVRKRFVVPVQATRGSRNHTVSRKRTT